MPAARRERSATTQSSRTDPRPQSRASTESHATHPAHPAHPPALQQHHSFHAYTTDEQLLAQQLGHAGNLMMDPSTQHYGQPQQDMPVRNPAAHYGPMTQQYDLQFGAQMAAPSGAETDDKRKRGPGANAANDKELRELIRMNDHKSLREAASDVISAERTSRAEKTKQLFAMLWLKGVCKVAKSSVPRSRVYSTYAERCATERVQPLNPASFGKLVRVIFPGIQTRRLGVRGESKYHYVDLALLDESEQRRNELQAAQANANLSRAAAPDYGSMPHLPADTAAFPTEEPVFESHGPVLPTGPSSQGTLFTNPYTPGFRSSNQSTSHMYQHVLKFPPVESEPYNESDAIELPNIYNYAPPKTDIDAADALTALYRTHCTSLVDCIRYCKEKQFFRLFTTFHGTLTVPVQKLLVHPEVTAWIKECDWLMYQKMLRFVSRLTLQVVPHLVLNFLNSVSKNLHGHLTKTFANLPQRVLEAKLEPATLFAGLLHRLLRVNSAAHAAANLLTVDAHRNQMWTEWVQQVNPIRIMESELPNCGYEEAYRILTHDIRSLLEPLSIDPFIEQNTHYQEAAMLAQNNAMNDANANGESPIDRIAAFLGALPSRFPQADTRTILHCISAIGTAALREITVENGPSFGAWWVTKMFVDEMALWLASLGGFLDHKPAPIEKKSEEPVSAVSLSNGHVNHFRSASAHLPTSGYAPSPQLSMGHYRTGSVQYNNSTANSTPDLGNFVGRNRTTTPVVPPPVQHIDNSQTTMPMSSFAQTGQSQDASSFNQSAYETSFQFNGTNDGQNIDNLDDSGIGMSLIDDSFDAKAMEALAGSSNQFQPTNLNGSIAGDGSI